MKISFFETDGEEEAYLRNALGVPEKLEVGLPGGNTTSLSLNFHREALRAQVLPALTDTDAEILSVFVGSTVDAAVLKRFPKLKYIATRSTGYDHIDLQACAGRKIVVSNIPSYGEHTVAEYAFGLILTLSRRLYEAVDQVREAGNFSVKGLRGFDLRGKTIGIIGCGNIGKHSARSAKGFGMRVLVYDVHRDEQLARDIGFEYKDLDELLTASDIVTIHVPYFKSTHHLLNRETIGKMKRGAYLINTSRGAIVETEALLEALKSGHLGGAGLDVLEEEGVTKDEFGYLYEVFGKNGAGSLTSSGRETSLPQPDLRIVLANHALIDMPNVIVTPHNAFNTVEGWRRILDTTIENVRGFTKGEARNIVKMPE